MTREKNTTSDGLEILHQRYYKGNPERLQSLQDELANADIARKIYDLRKEAGLTQKELAELIGTTPSVISRLEDSDYEGHSFSMLRRIAAAMQKQVQIDFISVDVKDSELQPTHTRSR